MERISAPCGTLFKVGRASGVGTAYARPAFCLFLALALAHSSVFFHELCAKLQRRTDGQPFEVQIRERASEQLERMR